MQQRKNVWNSWIGVSEGVVVWFVEVVRVINYYVVDKFYLSFVFFVGQDINSKFI